MSVRLFGWGLSVMALVGCASAPTFRTGEDYIRFAETWSATHSCSSAGHLDANTAAIGINHMTTQIGRTRYDPALLQREVGVADRKTWGPESCRSLAVAIHGWKAQQTLQRQDAADMYEAGKAFSDSMQNARPKHTTCNRMGTQMFCSTY